MKGFAVCHIRSDSNMSTTQMTSACSLDFQKQVGRLSKRSTQSRAENKYQENQRFFLFALISKISRALKSWFIYKALFLPKVASNLMSNDALALPIPPLVFCPKSGYTTILTRVYILYITYSIAYCTLFSHQVLLTANNKSLKQRTSFSGLQV